MEGAPHIKKPDADNVAKAVLDALNGLAFEDDSRIYVLNVAKRYTLVEPRVEVTMEWEDS
jgi:Holliday junction resolvase RusA-like endonuclease